MREPRDQQYTSSQTLERLLNEAIIHADISNNFEETNNVDNNVYESVTGKGLFPRRVLPFALLLRTHGNPLLKGKTIASG